MVLTLKELLTYVWFSKDGPWISYQYLLKLQIPKSHFQFTESESVNWGQDDPGTLYFNLLGTNAEKLI